MVGAVLVAAGCAAAGLATASGDAAATAACTYEQKQARSQALARFRKGMAAARATYYRKVKNRKKRAAFVAAQQRKLRTLKAAAACTVRPLAPSSAATCSFMLDPHPAVPWALHEGAPARGAVQRSLGRVDGVMLFLDFVDAQGANDGPPASIAPPFLTELGWFTEASYGRFSFSLNVVDSWIRMPAPTTAYLPLHTGTQRYLRDAVAAADPFVDFSRYQHVTFMNARGWMSNNPAITLPPGQGAFADGVEIRLGNILDPDTRRWGNSAGRVQVHEVMHTLGLPDLGGRAFGWDPLSAGNEPPPATHLLGWHSWLLGWLDPAQLTCVSSPGTLEETLTPIAATGGKKLVVVPITPTTAYAVEVRRPIGRDRAACGEGVLVYRLDSTKMSYEDPIVLLGTPRCGNITPGAFQTGQTAEDALVKVEVLATNGRDYRVRVTKK